MATQPQLQRLVGRILMDPTFREEVLNNPEATLKGLRMRLNADQLSRLKSLDSKAVERLAAEFRAVIPSPAGGPLSFW